MSLIVNLISASVSVADKAGIIIRDIMKNGQLKIIDKGINDLQTEADRRAQNLIISSLIKIFPKLTIIGEENLDPNEIQLENLDTKLDNDALQLKCPQDFLNVKEEDIVVWVDPLDGTSEYTQGLLDHVTVLIGVAVNGKAIGGVIHQPFFNYKTENEGSKLGRTVYGLVGAGVYGITRNNNCDGKRIIVTTRSHYSKNINDTLEAIKPDEVIRVGGAGNKTLYVIEGKANAYVYPSSGCKKWDTCAPDGILRAIGGKLTDIFGNELEYHKTVKHINDLGVIASYPEGGHNFYLERIPDDVKISLMEKSKS